MEMSPSSAPPAFGLAGFAVLPGMTAPPLRMQHRELTLNAGWPGLGLSRTRAVERAPTDELRRAPRWGLTPQPTGCDIGALPQRPELLPHDGRGNPLPAAEGAEAAVGRRNHPLAVADDADRLLE